MTLIREIDSIGYNPIKHMNKNGEIVNKMKHTFREDIEKRLDNTEFKNEYIALESEYKVIQSLIELRNNLNMTQKELSKLTGIDQADISRIERGLSNPTIKLLQKIAESLNMTLELRFVPKSEIHV